MSEEKMPDIAVVDSSDFQFIHHMKAFADLTDAIPELRIHFLPGVFYYRTSLYSSHQKAAHKFFHLSYMVPMLFRFIPLIPE